MKYINHVSKSLTQSACIIALCGGLAACNTATTTSPSHHAAFDSAAHDHVSTVKLTSHYWDLQSIQAADGKVTTPVQPSGKQAPRITFTNGRIVVDRICNTMSGAYEAGANTIKVSQVISTMMACIGDDVAKLERYVGTHLSKMQSYALQSNKDQPRLTLNFQDGSQWILAGSATPETLYGGVGERIFLEIAPQQKTCSDGVITSRKCLHVREIRYNEAGLKTFTGEWQYFYEQIEGFKHREGEYNIVRVKRYERKNVPADASLYVYILDMVVENGRAN